MLKGNAGIAICMSACLMSAPLMSCSSGGRGAAPEGGSAPAGSVIDENTSTNVDGNAESQEENAADANSGDSAVNEETAAENEPIGKPTVERVEVEANAVNDPIEASDFVDSLVSGRSDGVSPDELQASLTSMGYSAEDAEKAARQSDVDWDAQADLYAKRVNEQLEGHLDHDAIIDILTSVGFTEDEAAHGAKSIGM